MKISPSRLVEPQPISGWATVVRSPKDLNLDTGHALALCGESSDITKELDLDEGQFLVVAFRPSNESATCYSYLLVRADPVELKPVVIGDSRVQGFFPDAMEHMSKLAAWRPGIKAFEKAGHDVEYAFALRCAMEMSSQPKKQDDIPHEPSFEDFKRDFLS
jgi:hypothetical protein